MEHDLGQGNSREHVASANIPDDNLAIATSTEQNIVGGRMPGDEANTTLMAMQLDHWLGECACQTIVGNLPHLDGGVFRRAGNNIVVEWTPGYVQHRTFVSRHQGLVDINATSLGEKK